jgi:hypothetical protein
MEHALDATNVEGLEGGDGVGALGVDIPWVEVEGDKDGVVAVRVVATGGGREALARGHGNCA